MRASRIPRLVRGVLASSFATLAALLSHLSAGGEMPGWWGIFVPWILALMVSTLLCGRRLSIVRLGAAVTVSQVLFHTLFVVGLVTPSAGAGHAHHMPMVLPGASEMIIPAGAAMWFMHAVAAAVTVAVLAYGEIALLGLRVLATQIVSWVRRRFDASLAHVRLAYSAPRAAHSLVHRAHSAFLRTAIHRRGPPALSTL